MLLQKTAADTWSVTLTPSVTSVTASNGTGATTAAGRFTNSTNSNDVVGLIVEGARGLSAANSDFVSISYYMSDSLGNQEEFGRLALRATTVTHGTETSRWFFYTRASGTVAARMLLDSGKVGPVTNDGLALGESTVGFSDAFFANGAVIGFNSSAYTLTHSTGLLTASGAIQARVPLSSETTGTLTVASANKKVVCTGGITIPDSVFTADDFILFDPGTSARTFTGSITDMFLNGTDAATATLAANQMGTVHFRGTAGAVSTAAVLSGAFS
jgi:hypothetical protein